MKRSRALAIAGSLGALMGACGGHVGDVDDTSGGEPRGDVSGAGGRRGNGGRTGNGSVTGVDGGVANAGGAGQGGGAGEVNDGGRQGLDSGVSAAGAGPDGEAGSASGGSGVGPAGDASATEVWVGQIQSTITIPEFPDNRNYLQHVVMVLRRSAKGSIAGSILIGDHAPPPAATDPEAFYPDLGISTYSLGFLLHNPLNGFAYSLLDLHIQDHRVTARFAPSELWRDWCAMQTTSYPSSRFPEFETCAPDGGPFSNGSELAHRKADLCVAMVPPVCRCAANACQANSDLNFTWNLDIELRDGLYEGKVDSNSEYLPGMLRLRRVE